MAVYNRKGFVRGIITLVICIFGMLAIFIRGFSLKLAILLIISFLFAITELSRSFSRTASLEDKLADTDERDKYILLKTSHKSMQILQVIYFVIAILLMVLYAITKNSICLGALVLSGINITICFIVTLVTNTYYEKHE